MTEFEILQRKALDAINRGADPAAVNARLKSLAVSKGFADDKTEFNLQKEPTFDNVKSDFNNVQSGSSTDAWKNVEAGADTNDFANDSPYVARAKTLVRNETKAGVGLALKGLGGVAVAAGAVPELLKLPFGGLNSLGEGNPAFAAAKALSETGDEIRSGAHGLGADAGNIAGGILPTSIVGLAPMEAADEATDGKSLSDAYKNLAKGTAITEAQLASGLLFRAAPGLGGVLKRAAVQIPSSVALTAADKKLSGEEITKKDLEVAAGMGAFGSLFKEAPSTKKAMPDLAKTGDAAIDAGMDFAAKAAGEKPAAYDFEAAAKRQEDIIKRRTAPEQTDMFTTSGESAVQGDMFGKPVDASLAEARRAEDIQSPVTRNPDQQAALEKSYFQQRQERLRAQREAADAATREQGLRQLEEQHAAGDNPEASSPHPDFWDVGVPRNEQPVESTIQGTPDNPTGYTEEAPNEAMRQAFADAGTRRALGLQNENLYPDIRQEPAPEARPPVEDIAPPQQDLFQPTQPEVVEQAQTQLPFPEQPDMFNTGDTPNTFKPYSKEPVTTAPVPNKPRSLEESIAEMKSRRAGITAAAPMGFDEIRNAEGAGVFAKNHNIPATMMDKLASNKLHGTDVVEGIINSVNIPDGEAKQHIRELKTAMGRFGGGEVKVEINDAHNPVHKEIVDRANAHGNLPFAQSRALYDPVTHTILLNKNASLATLAHEVDHAVTYMALDLGEQGKLRGTAHQAYKDLNQLHGALEKYVTENSAEIGRRDLASGKSREEANAGHGRRIYGMSNLKELSAELRSNQDFRNYLKTIKPADLDLGKIRNHYIRKAKSVFDAFTKGFSKLLGLSDKGDTAYDMLYKAHDKFFSSIDERDASAMRDIKRTQRSGVDAPNLDFLGEQAMPRSVEDSLVGAKRLGKTILRSKGLEPLATQARNVREGISAVGDAEAAQAGNRLKAVVTSANREAVGKALAGDIDALKSLDPKAKAVVKQEILNNYDNSVKIAEQIVADPNKTPEHEAIAHKIIENAGRYQTRVYEADLGTKYMKQKLQLADDARAKIAAGQEISDVELRSLKDVDAAKKYLQNHWLPTTDKLPSMKNADLEELYKFHTGLAPDQQFKGLDPKDRKLAMAGAVAEKLRQMTDPENTLDQIVRSVAGLGEKGNTNRQYYAGMRRSADVYSHLQHVPEELRNFWGEVTEPIARQVATIRAQYNYMSNLASQNHLRETGLTSGLFSNNRTKEHSEVLTGEKMGPLQGMFVSPDTKKAVDSVFTMNSAVGDLLDSALADRSGASLMVNAAAKVGKGITQVAGITKLASVLGNVGNLANNFIGSHLQLLSNGNINPVMWSKGAKTMLDSMLIERRSSMTPDVKDALRYKLLEFSHIQELQKNNAKSRMAEYIKTASDQPDPLMYLKKALDAGKIPLETYKEVYGAMDLWTKLANWHNEADFWKQHNEKYNLGLSEDQIKQSVADRINDTNITPSLAPQLIKGLERYGITRFATYYAEVARTSKNNALIGVKDMADSVKGDFKPDLFWHGFKRLAGTSASVAAQNKQIAMLAAGIAGAMGLATEQMSEDDPRRKYMKKDDFLKNTDPLIVKDPLHPEAGEYSFDLSRPDPYGPISMPARNFIEAATKAAKGDKEGAMESLKLGADNVSSLWAPNTMWKAIANIAAAKAPGIKHTAPEFYNSSMETLTGLGLTTKAADRLLTAIQPVEPKTILNILASKEVKSPGLAGAVASGLGVNEFNVGKDIGAYLGAKAKNDINDAKSEYLSLLKQDFQSSPERIEKAFVSSLKQAAGPYNKLASAVEAAKAQGTSRSDLVKLLKASGVSDDMSRALIRGKSLQAKDISGDLSKDLQGDLIESISDPTKKREANRRFRQNEREINALIRKYRNVDLSTL